MSIISEQNPVPEEVLERIRRILEVEARRASVKSRVWIEPYLRADGVDVIGHWRNVDEGFNAGIWYHVTSAFRENEILESGLKPQGEGTEVTTRANLSQEGVYLWPRLEDAEAWVDYARRRGWGDDFTIFRVQGLDGRRIAPDPETFDYVLRYFLYQEGQYGVWEPREGEERWMPTDADERHMAEALDQVDYYEDAIGGPQRVTLREWLLRRQDKDRWVWFPATPHEQYPEWFSPEKLYEPHLRLLNAMPDQLRWKLAAWMSESPKKMNSVVHLGAVSPEKLEKVLPRSGDSYFEGSDGVMRWGPHGAAGNLVPPHGTGRGASLLPGEAGCGHDGERELELPRRRAGAR